MQTFFWHDYETFGRVPRRDRPAQFAGIRTDAELNEIGSPVMWFCQPAPDTLPDPEACLLTGILPQHCLQKGLPEHLFAAAIEEQLSQPGTVGVGYNSIRFDDEVTRHLFWRNLIDPYAREWRNGCGRWDLMDAVRCCWALRPEGIEWPFHPDGRPSFKLEDLTRVNGLSHDAAHDALSDVRATLALARLIKNKQPKLWDFCFKLHKKDAVANEIGAVGQSAKPFIHLSGMYPVERGGLAVVWPLAMHPTNKNEVIVWDLAFDPALLEGLDAATVRQRLYTRQDELPEGVQRLPIKSIHINKSPVVIATLKTVAPVAQRWSLNIDQALAYAERARQLTPTFAHLWPDVFARAAPSSPPDVDEDLYGGFIGNEDRRRLDGLLALPVEQRLNKSPAFNDPRLDELFFRYRARNFAAQLSEADSARWQQHCADRLLQGAGGAVTLAAFLERIDVLAQSADERGQAILGALVDYAQSVAPLP